MGRWMRAVRGTAVLTLFAAGLLSAGPAPALTFAEQEFVCPIGGEAFKARVVASQTRFGQRLDLRPIGALAAPVPLPVCPGNGFVMFKQDFTEDEIAKLRPIVMSGEYRTARARHNDQYMVAYMLERTGAPVYSIGHAYLRASWQAENAKADAARLALYRSLALRNFEAHLKDTKERDANWWTAAILTAEMERMLGRFEQAVARISALPMDELKAGSAQAAALEQIKTLAQEKKQQPEKLDYR